MPKPVKSNEWDRYQKADIVGRQRIIAASFGEVGVLKTSFWLTAPPPIVIQSTDHGLEGVVDTYLKDLYDKTGKVKDIYVVEYDPSTADVSQEELQEVRAKFEDDFDHALNHARTIVWDKETQVYEIFKYAEFGAPSDAPSNYYALDQRYRHLINKAKETDVNFGLIQSMRDAWVPKVNKKTGAQGAAKTEDRIRRGMREIEELVHINIEHALEDGEFMLRIGKSRGPGGRDIQNTTIPYLTFPEFAQLVFPESSEEDWL